MLPESAPSVPEAGVTFVCSWSGGKDSCLALHRAVAAGARPAFLLVMMREDGQRSRSHGLTASLLRAQASALGIPLVTRRASWPEYEDTFIAALRDLQAAGATAAVFGDIDIEDHGRWEAKVCEAAGLACHLPLWKTPRVRLLDDLVSLGFSAIVVATNAEKLGRQYLGRTLDWVLVREFERIGIDPSGEEGEYHTLVTDGPSFATELQMVVGGATLESGYWFLDVGHRPT